MRLWLINTLILVAVAAPGCIRIKPDPVEIKPIHITVDVNVRMEKELQNFFGAIDEEDPTMDGTEQTE